NLTLREDERVVGQVHLNDLSQEKKQDLDCENLTIKTGKTKIN
ncbi:unnamed protein product, partial [Rotaria sp. Silwood2]